MIENLFSKAIADALYQVILVSGTNIKTVNGQSLLGSGDLVLTASAAWGSITGTLSSQTDLQNALNDKAATDGTLAQFASTTSAQLAGVRCKV